MAFTWDLRDKEGSNQYWQTRELSKLYLGVRDLYQLNARVCQSTNELDRRKKVKTSRWWDLKEHSAVFGPSWILSSYQVAILRLERTWVQITDEQRLAKQSGMSQMCEKTRAAVLTAYTIVISLGVDIDPPQERIACKHDVRMLIEIHQQNLNGNWCSVSERQSCIWVFLPTRTTPRHAMSNCTTLLVTEFASENTVIFIWGTNLNSE